MAIVPAYIGLRLGAGLPGRFEGKYRARALQRERLRNEIILTADATHDLAVFEAVGNRRSQQGRHHRVVDKAGVDAGAALCGLIAVEFVGEGYCHHLDARELRRRHLAQRAVEGFRSEKERTVQRHFARLGLNTRPDGTPPEAFGRFEAAAANDRWTGDALHGPAVGGHKAYLFAFLDDHSRALTGYRWGHSEDAVRLEAALRHGLGSRGVPRSVYVDNGSAFVAAPLLRACAVLGIRLIHSRPGRPEGRGKIERFFRTVRDQFLVEVEHRGVTDLIEMNRLFAAWVETAYHRRTHSETGDSPLDRFVAGGPFAIPTPAQLHEAFLWSEHRSVTKTATVSLHGNTFEVDAALVGRRVECVFDPFDLTRIEVRWHGKPYGLATPRQIGRHAHPKARPEPPAAAPPAATGVDYLGILAAEHDAAQRRRINYGALAGDGGQLPGQATIDEALPDGEKS